MTCDFTSFSIVVHSYRDDKGLIMKAICNEIPFMFKKILPPAELDFGTARSVGQRLTH